MKQKECFVRSAEYNATDASNFVIDKSDRFVEQLLSNLSLITLCAVAIGAITLLGAAVGLMNILLVSVTERTKEIGLVKAIGGKKASIRMQFLYESIMISLLGAVFGSFLGILIGNVFSLVLNTGFVFPMDLAFSRNGYLYRGGKCFRNISLFKGFTNESYSGPALRVTGIFFNQQNECRQRFPCI